MSQDIIVLEPKTSLTSFDNITWAIQRVVSGTIASMLYPDKEEQRKFYKSYVNRKNKKTLLELASQVYSYLNGTISEFADIRDYAFRIWVQLIMSRKDGNILGQPIFDVEVYKYVGKVAAQTIEAKDYSSSIQFIGQKEDRFITPFMMKALKTATAQTKYIKLELYSDPNTAPKSLINKVIEQFPTLIIGENAYAVKSRISETGKIQVYIKEGTNELLLNSEDDIEPFIFRKVGLKPEILGTATGFQSVDKEIREISNKIDESAKPQKIDLLENLKLDDTFEELELKLKPLKEAKLADELNRELIKIDEKLKEMKEDYRALKREYDVEQDELENLSKEREENKIEFDVYRVHRMRCMRNVKRIEQEIIDIQANVKRDLVGKIRKISIGIEQKGKEKKLNEG